MNGPIVRTVAAFCAAILGSMGMGGGGVLLLYLSLVAQTPQMAAQGINLLFFLPVGGVALLLHWKNHLVQWKMALPAILWGLLGAAAGSWLAGFVGNNLLQKGFGSFLLVIGLRELFTKKQVEKENSSPAPSRHKTPRPGSN